MPWKLDNEFFSPACGWRYPPFENAASCSLNNRGINVMRFVQTLEVCPICEYSIFFIPAEFFFCIGITVLFWCFSTQSNKNFPTGFTLKIMPISTLQQQLLMLWRSRKSFLEAQTVLLLDTSLRPLYLKFLQVHAKILAIPTALESVKIFNYDILDDILDSGLFFFGLSGLLQSSIKNNIFS